MIGYLYISLMNCFNCASPKKYKCSSCKIPYCSVACYKEHKPKCEGHVPEPTATQHLTI